MSSYAKLLSGSPQRRLTIEGHRRARQSRVQPRAGLKRAEAVRKSSLLGVKDTQMEAVSFGEERPAACPGEEAGEEPSRRTEPALRTSRTS